MSQMLKSSGAMAAATLTSRVLGMVRLTDLFMQISEAILEKTAPDLD